MKINDEVLLWRAVDLVFMVEKGFVPGFASSRLSSMPVAL